MFNLFLNILSIFTIISFVCFAILLLIKRTNHKKANHLLAVLFFAYAYGQFHLFLFNTKLIYEYSFLLNIDFIIITAHSILFYLFVCEMTGVDTKLNKRFFFLISPTLIPIAHWVVFPFIYDSPDKVNAYLDAAFIKLPINVTLINTYFTIVNIVFLYLSYKRVKVYSIQIKQFLSDIHSVNLLWLKQVTLFFLIIFLTLPILLILMQNQNMNCLYGQITFSIFYFFLFFRTIHQSAVFSNVDFSIEVQGNIKKSKYARSQIKEEDITLFYQKIKSCVEKEELYLKPDITIKELSEKTGINIHSLSQIINQEFKMNFFELINSYRVEKAKTLLLSKDFANYSIESIGYDSGFGTKSSFYNVFKKFTAQTPLEFRNNTQKKDSEIS
jgi:AraC-like DNA-binding protein